MKQVRFAMGLLCAVSAFAATPVSASSGGTSRPFTESGSQTGWIQCLNADCSQNLIRLEGPNIGSHIGAGSMVCTDTCTRVTANGDLLTSRTSSGLDASDVVCRDGEFPVKSIEEFTGGTGRFAHASGSYVVRACVTFGNPINDEGLFEFFLRYVDTGTISH